MSFVTDRIILILLSIGIMSNSLPMEKIVVLTLINVIIAGITYCFDSRQTALILSGVYIALALLIPELIYIVPVIMYITAYQENGIEIGLVFLLFVICMIYNHIPSGINCYFLALTLFLAILLQYQSKKNSQLKQLVREIRDNSVEKNMLLAEKNVRLIEKQDQEVYVATLKERNRIAREIHDNVGHMLTRSILQMGALLTINKEEPLHGQLLLVKDNLDVAMNNIRESVHDLHDDSVDVKQSIIEMATPLKEKFECKIEYDAEKNIDRKYKYAILGIVKEAISNIIKHSNNDQVEITIREHPGVYQVVVWDYSDKKDDSKQVQYNLHQGIGLENMMERVKALNGNLIIDNNKGFRLFVTLPRI